MNNGLEKVLDTDKKKSVAEYIKQKPFLVFKFRKIYNGLCVYCKKKHLAKVRSGKTLEYDDFCDNCKKKANKILGVDH